MHVVQVRGKRTRGVRKMHLVITPDEKEIIEYVLQHRTVQRDYVLTPYDNKPMNGCQIIRELKAECPGLQNPDIIRSRRLRKYIAMTTEVNYMNGGGSKMIADHLGHNLNMYTDVYCLQSSLLERTKVARLLLAVENGCVPDFRGKSFSELSIEQIPLPTEYCEEWDATKCAADQGKVQIPTSLSE